MSNTDTTKTAPGFPGAVISHVFSDEGLSQYSEAGLNRYESGYSEAGRSTLFDDNLSTRQPLETQGEGYTGGERTPIYTDIGEEGAGSGAEVGHGGGLHGGGGGEGGEGGGGVYTGGELYTSVEGRVSPRL